MPSRRSWISRAAATVVAASWASAQAQTSASAANPHAHHDHGNAAAPKPSRAAAPKGLDNLISAYQKCQVSARRCISHCQKLLASGDKSVGNCLRTALDVDVSCDAVLKLAGTESTFTAAYAKASLAVMQACVEACKEHIEHHAECKACHDGCLSAMAAAKKLG
jgi:Cys-rich four helix bundle protein (predicted Tat secretion target)